MKKSVCLVRLFAGLLCLIAATSCVIPLNPQGNLAGFSIRLGSANARSQPGIVDAGTKAVEANVNGNRIGNAINCATSLFGADNPMQANPQEIA
jgi:hypothetical protein